MELGDFTLIAGRNNIGKTYLVYTLYGFLKMWKEMLAGEYSCMKEWNKLGSDNIHRASGCHLHPGVIGCLDGAEREHIDGSGGLLPVYQSVLPFHSFIIPLSRISCMSMSRCKRHNEKL